MYYQVLKMPTQKKKEDSENGLKEQL